MNRIVSVYILPWVKKRGKKGILTFCCNFWVCGYRKIWSWAHFLNLRRDGEVPTLHFAKVSKVAKYNHVNSLHNKVFFYYYYLFSLPYVFLSGNFLFALVGYVFEEWYIFSIMFEMGGCLSLCLSVTSSCPLMLPFTRSCQNFSISFQKFIILFKYDWVPVNSYFIINNIKHDLLNNIIKIVIL